MRAYSASWTRRLIPARAAAGGVNAYAALAQQAGVWAAREAQRFYRDLLQYTERRGDDPALVRRGVAEYFHWNEMFWRPWLMARGDADGLEHLRDAASAGRGVVAVYPHFGMIYAQFPILARAGVDVWAVATQRRDVVLGNGYDGRFMRLAREYLGTLGAGRVIEPRSRLTASPGAFAPALQRLRAGATVTIAFDLAGSAATPFLGRRLHLASGPSLLAWEARAVVVPFVIRRRGYRPLLRFAPPLDPRGFASSSDLQAAIARPIERWAIEQPEAVWPLERQDGVPLLVRGASLADAAGPVPPVDGGPRFSRAVAPSRTARSADRPAAPPGTRPGG